MATQMLRDRSARAWQLAAAQHGVVTRSQLLELGMSADAIRHRLARGRLHRLMPGVYAVGRPGLGQRGRWRGALLACGPDALLGRRSAAALLGLRKPAPGRIEVVVPAHVVRRHRDIWTYRRPEPPGHRREVDGIPVTDAIVTLVDLATCLPSGQLEAAINEADHRDLVDPERLRSALDDLPRRRGARRLRELLDAASHRLTTTELERRFLPLCREAGLPEPETQVRLSGHRVDFYWAGLGLVVETDGLRYHRTALKQGSDKRRDNAHAGSGLATLRFSHGQVYYEPAYVRAELRRVASRLALRHDGIGP
jgi:very-short-patch-repair endonuclease